jgi:hypothetical protein
MAISAAGHRVIGIRHTLRKLKDVGLVDEDSLYAGQAVRDVQGEMMAVARRWYQVGARRGALEILKAILDGDFDVQTSKGGKREIVASAQAVTWIRSLKVSAGNKKKRVPKRTYKLTLKDLHFEG